MQPLAGTCQLFIRKFYNDGGNRTVTIDINLDDRVSTLKNKIFDKLGVSKDLMLLQKGDTWLTEDDKKLKDYSIYKEAEIKLRLRFRSPILTEDEKEAERLELLAYSHLRGINGCIKNNETAVQLLIRSASLGRYSAQHTLGVLYLYGQQDHGYHAKINIAEAVRWFKKCIENKEDGYRENSISELKQLIKEGKEIDTLKTVFGGKEALARILSDKFAKLLSYQESYPALLNNEEHQEQLAIERTKFYASIGEATAQELFELGSRYDKGSGLRRPSNFWSTYYYKLAADKGHVGALCLLGNYYECGLKGCRKNVNTAIDYYKAAALQGSISAYKRLVIIYGNRKEYWVAWDLFQVPALQGDKDALYELGVMREKGLGVEKDETDALEYYRLAAENGRVEAKADYDRLSNLLQTKKLTLPALKLASLAYQPTMIDDQLTQEHRKVIKLPEGHGFISYNGDAAKPVIMVAFRGTDNLDELLFLDFKYLPLSLEPLNAQGLCHRGFLERYLMHRETIKGAIETFITENNLTKKNVTLVFTGHSLGGAVANLAALDLKKNSYYENTVKLITANSPRVFDPGMATTLEGMLKSENIIRLWRDKDLVSAVPLGTTFITSYSHVSFKGYKVPQREDAMAFDEYHSIDHMVKWVEEKGIDSADTEHEEPYLAKSILYTLPVECTKTGVSVFTRGSIAAVGKLLSYVM